MTIEGGRGSGLCDEVLDCVKVTSFLEDSDPSGCVTGITLLTVVVVIVPDLVGRERPTKGGVRGLGLGVLSGILIPAALHSLISTFC